MNTTNKILASASAVMIFFMTEPPAQAQPDYLTPYAQLLAAQPNLMRSWRGRRNFLRSKAKGLKVERTGIRLSKNFDWFEEDFGKDEKQLKLWLRAYVPAVKASTEIVGYFDYNWTLNCSSCEVAPASSQSTRPMKR